MIELTGEQRVGLRKFLATEVMGWGYVKPPADYEFYLDADTGVFQVTVNRWQPDRDLNQAWQAAVASQYLGELAFIASSRSVVVRIYPTLHRELLHQQGDISQPALALSVAVAKARGWQP